MVASVIHVGDLVLTGRRLVARKKVAGFPVALCHWRQRNRLGEVVAVYEGGALLIRHRDGIIDRTRGLVHPDGTRAVYLPGEVTLRACSLV
ncbi:MAG: hypothetical protein WC768_00765 [Patescibacteria group bacterium]|jgi:hypothetical protein